MIPNHAGQIVRIHLENFMSYDNIEVFPGSHLNLIVGPNGTGKSSLVCAVLLGLGGKLKTLGRADQLSSYVKSGCNQCCIEIELFEPKGKNVVIKRKILSNNQSEFMVNGVITNASKVIIKINDIRKKYNVQIDNLCTFLPQEKVQDFAKLNPQQLLDQTQRTVGQGDLVQLHEELKTLQAKTFEQEKHNQLLQNELENEIQKNDRLKDKIKCFKEKQSLCDKLVILKQKKAWVEYENEVKNYKEVNEDFKSAEKLYNTKKEEFNKFNASIEECKKNVDFLQQKLSQARKDEAGKHEVLEEWLRRTERRIDSLEDLRNATQLKLNEEEDKKKEMLKYKESAEKLTNDLRTLDASIGSEAESRLEEEKVSRKLKETHLEETRLNQIKVDLEEDEDTLKQEMRNTVTEYEHLKKRKNIRLEYLKKHEPDVFKSMEWLEKNRHLFHSRIYNPMLLELDVPNSKMAKYVEALLGYKDLISFTCTNPDDLNLLIAKLRTEQKLKVNAICSDEFDNSQYVPEIPISNLKPYGFFSYVKDLVAGPNDIIRFLCKTYKMHCIPVGDESVKANCAKVPQNIPLFYSDNHVFSVKYSVYSGDKSISVKKLGEPNFFAESMDEGRIQILMAREKDLENKLNNKRAEIKNVDNQIHKLRQTLEEVKKIKRELSTKAEERNQIQRNLNRAVANYNASRNALKDPVEIQKEADKLRESLKKEVYRSLEEIKKADQDFFKMKSARQLCELEYKVCKFEINQITEEKSQLMEEVSRYESLLRDVKERRSAAELKCLQLKDRAKQLTNNASKEEEAFAQFQKKFSKFPNTLDDLEAEIEETQAKADFLQGGNYQVLQDYEKREERIARLRENLESHKNDLSAKKAELNSRQDRWLIPVNELVEKINVNFGKFFEAMGCAGEVCLISGENKCDFEQYGIKILVKFRDGTPLQELGRYFQSGGERAVATAIFMLSLQELTSVPFRFVDEINQGMDLENEKRILQLIVRVTDSEHSTQYFFITPKLLPDLKCSNTMTVHCIYNGPHAIAATQWDIKKFLRKRTSTQIEDEDSS